MIGIKMGINKINMRSENESIAGSGVNRNKALYSLCGL